MAYGIGLDCGTTSVGWAVMELDSNDEPRRIINLGSRIFQAAENPKDGSSLAAPRRESRSARRRLRRHRHRNERIRNLIVDSGIISADELATLFDGKELSDIYQIRTEALDRKLTDKELARVMIHIAQRRGFKSNRKKPGDSDEGKLLAAVSENEALMQAKGYRTAGEMLYKDEKFALNKRNKGENYTNTFSRALVEDEIKLIFEAQRRLGNKKATAEIEEKYLDISLSQRSFEEGPGGDSKYGGNQIEKMRGRCTFFPDEPRAPKASYTFQLFNLWQKINSIRIIGGGSSRGLTDEERKLIFDYAHEKADIKFSDLRKKLNLTDDERFNLVNYSKDKSTEESEKTKFNYLKAYHEIRKALDKVAKGRIKYYSRETLDRIGEIFTVCKNDEAIIAELSEIDTEIDTEQLLTLDNFKQFGHISIKACNMLLPYLEQGMKYSEACEAAGIDFKAHNETKGMFLPGYAPEISALGNPVVRRAVSQTIKVINAIIREQNESPVYINIELAREMSKGLDERRAITKRIEENRAANERALARIRENYGIANARGLDLVKFKLWEEQDGICPYSLKHIPAEKIFEPGYAEVDHILPYSISFDDSYKNKVLVLASENRMKGNRLPLEYLSGKRREDYIVWVNANVKNFRKKQIMLKEKVTEEDRNRLRERSLQDTQYLSTFLYNYINDRLEFAPSVSVKKKRVTSVNGAITSYVRKRWGIAKIREDGDLHHAADAAVIACVTNGMVKRISDYSKYKEIRYTEMSADDASFIIDMQTGEVVDEFPYPYPNFRKELEIRLSNNPQSILKDIILPNYTSEEQEAVKPCFVSRMPTRKTKGPAHKDTVRSPRLLEETGEVITKTPLNKLKLDKKTGEIEGYYNPGSDRLLYEALKTRLVEFGGNAEAAFKESFYKPTSSGKQGPLVKKVKICEKSSLAVPVHGGKGVAANDTMVRIDVFYVENDGYYFVPVYVADTVKPELPNLAVVQGKEWKKMKEEDFLFSLYPNDLILAKSKNEITMSLKFTDSSLPKEHICKDDLMYFVKASISTASVTVSSHDSAYIIPSFGIKSLVSLEKYEVDPLGNCRKVGKEKRKGFKVQ